MPTTELERLQKRGQAIAAMGLVERDQSHLDNNELSSFVVLTPSLRGRQQSYKVTINNEGRIRCNCLAFEEDNNFTCEHIHAVNAHFEQKHNRTL